LYAGVIIALCMGEQDNNFSNSAQTYLQVIVTKKSTIFEKCQSKMSHFSLHLFFVLFFLVGLTPINYTIQRSHCLRVHSHETFQK